MLLSCSKHSEYTADYATFDSIPYNVETNVRATTSVIKTYPGSYMFKSEYPQYDATVNFGLVTVSDSAKIAKVIKNQFDRMADNLGIHEGEIKTFRPDSTYIGWVMITPQCPTPVLMMVTDSMNMVLHATMKFNSPKSDTIGTVLPATEAIATDMEHIINNLKLR